MEKNLPVDQVEAEKAEAEHGRLTKVCMVSNELELQLPDASGSWAHNDTWRT